MKKLFTYISALCLCISINAQEDLNMELVGFLATPESANDVWGFVANNGKEYAIVGTRQNTQIIDLSEPSKPALKHTIAGTNTVWRDIKTYNDYIYVTTDGAPDGLLIIDATDLDNAAPFNYYRPSIEVESGDSTIFTTLGATHNIYIDEDGYAYLAGSEIGVGGVVIMDLNSNPEAPEVVGIENEAYAHDVFVRDNLMYTSEIYRGAFGIYDVTDKSNPTYLAGTETSSNFTHNAWLSDDGNYLFTTDERADAWVDAYDISDFDNIQRLDQFKSLETANTGVIPHNTHVLNDYLVTSWYTDGVVVTDASHPDNLVKVGSFDTYDEADIGFFGCWGAFPFLPSGLLLSSDRQTGLYVLQPTYIRASRLEGTITDINTGAPINNVDVLILSAQENFKTSNGLGEYKTGIATAGTYDVVFSHPDYTNVTASATIEAGEVTILDIEMGQIVDTDDALLHDDFEIAPNPFSSFTSINLAADKFERLEVFDILGRPVANYNVDKKTNFEIGYDYQAGIYLVRITDKQDQTQTYRIIKE